MPLKLGNGDFNHSKQGFWLISPVCLEKWGVMD
jgi:hypothetical protein